MKKVAIIGPAYPYRGGQALVEAYLYKHLTEAGFEVNTITFTLLYPSFLFPGKTQYDESKLVPYEHSEKIKRVINTINPITWIKAFIEIKKMKPDVVVFVWWMFFLAPCYWTIATLVKLFTKTKIVFLVENYFSHESYWFEKLIVKSVLNKADYFICESDYVCSKLRKYHPSIPIYKTTLSVYDVYDLGKYDKIFAREELGIPAEADVILFAGLIRPYKGLDKLIKAFPLIKAKNPDAFLLIVGEAYEDVNKYRKLISETGVSDSIKFENRFIPNEELELYYKSADIVCLPYYSATQSGIMMIAYAFGKPVVVTDVGGLKELVVENKTGIVIPNNDEKIIAEACLNLLQQDLEEYSKNIKQLNKTLGYKNIGEIFENII